uniref:Uncharacterized protein n=1 Tax=Ciona savignyi TaxID=51511 RepID=H2ZQF4_CIOSA
SIDGKCNNKINPFAGVVATPLKRLIQPEYGDGLSAPRRSVSGGELPNPRMISNALNDTKTASRHVNAMFVTFGQFITHDLVLTPETKGKSSKRVNGVEVNCSCSNPHHSCVNIPVPRGDPLHATTTCIPMKGTKVVHGCGNYPAENINLLPSYIDGNMIYGSSEEMLQTLRDQSSGKKHIYIYSLLTRKNVPSNISRIITCPGHLNPPGSTCFVSGERRLNENIGLSSLHLLFSREHNRIARRLNFLNRNWDSDTVFFETRRIIVAMIQVITYNEFLPLLLGRSYAKRFGLDLLTQGNYFGYNPTFDAGVSSAFATAAFRYGHTQVGASFSRLASDYIRSEFPTVPMRKALFQQAAVVNGSSHSILRGMMEDPALEVAPNMVDDLKNHMFESSSQPGKDLLAINIHRGRLHGLPGYNKYREFCGLNRARNWSDLASTINESMVTKLSAIYSHVDDIDLMIGGIAETPLSAGSVGPTFGCIIAHQFRDVRKGDRFWFENPGIFSKGQLQELRRASFSRVICDNMENMTTISPYAMLLSTVDSNSRINCGNIEPLNLALW